MRIGPYLFYIEQFITQFKEKMAINLRGVIRLSMLSYWAGGGGGGGKAGIGGAFELS